MQVNTSFRSSDILKLRIGEVFFQEQFKNQIWNRQNKTDRTNMLSISSSILFDLKEALAEYNRLFFPDYFSHPELPLFPSGQKQGSKFVPLAYSTYQNIIKKLIRAIGLNPDLYGTHSLRSAVPLEFFEKEGDIVTTSHMFGHRSTATTQIYVEEVAKKKASEMKTKYNFSD